MPTELSLFSIRGLPEISAGIDLGATIAHAVTSSGRTFEAGDVVVVAQKVVSKSEGAVVALHEIAPSQLAADWSAAHGKDPRLIEVVLRESKRIVRMDRGVIIAETRHGFICANAGVDTSNVRPGYATLLPPNPDESALRLSTRLSDLFGVRVAVIVADTFGRPWREGVVNVALGVSGLMPLLDQRGRSDDHGRPLQSTIVALADELASAAELVMGKTARTPVVVIRGAAEWAGPGSGQMLVRDAARDMFR